jgi:hypothetical protein
MTSITVRSVHVPPQRSHMSYSLRVVRSEPGHEASGDWRPYCGILSDKSGWSVGSEAVSVSLDAFRMNNSFGPRNMVMRRLVVSRGRS